MHQEDMLDAPALTADWTPPPLGFKTIMVKLPQAENDGNVSDDAQMMQPASNEKKHRPSMDLIRGGLDEHTSRRRSSFELSESPQDYAGGYVALRRCKFHSRVQAVRKGGENRYMKKRMIPDWPLLLESCTTTTTTTTIMHWKQEPTIPCITNDGSSIL